MSLCSPSPWRSSWSVACVVCADASDLGNGGATCADCADASDLGDGGATCAVWADASGLRTAAWPMRTRAACATTAQPCGLCDGGATCAACAAVRTRAAWAIAVRPVDDNAASAARATAASRRVRRRIPPPHRREVANPPRGNRPPYPRAEITSTPKTFSPPFPSVCLRCSKDGGGPASLLPFSQTPSSDKEKPPHQHPQQASCPGAAASSQPLRPWNLRTACGEIGRFGEGVRVGGWRLPAAAGGPTQEEGLLRHAHEGRDHRGLRRHPRQPPAAPAQEAPEHRAAPVDMLYPGLSLADVNLDSYKIDEALG
ncbi:uncharacterized protein [Miscanthus floridulus]|uniref:uncharacterized protein n=1 Tax=Miscanthus floridulus TaxID=154761 RepID=UPI00345AA86C